MAILNLSVSSVPSSNSGIARIVLLVSVTQDQGLGVSGLRKGNFDVRWIRDDGAIAPIDPLTVTEFTGIPGVYAIEVPSKSEVWSKKAFPTIFVVVHTDDGANHGQTLYPVGTPALDLPVG